MAVSTMASIPALKTVHQQLKARMDKAGSMTAVDDLNSYTEIAGAHADGLHKFTPVFTTLYGSMSDSQKANADNIFRTHGGKSRRTHSKAG